VCIASEDGERSSKKIAGGSWIGFLRFAFLNLFHHLVDVWVGGTYARDCGRVLLDQAEERNVLQVCRDADFNNGFRLMLFRRVKLREARPQNMRLQIVAADGYGILFHSKVYLPDLRPVIIRRVAEEDDLEQRLVRFQIDRMMELGNQRAQFFQKGYADLFEVRFGAPFGDSVGIHSAKVGNIPVEPNGPGLRGDLPFGCAEENADVPGVNRGDARRNRFGFERVIDGGENDGVIGNMDDGAAAG